MNKPIRIATLEAYVSGDARDIGDLKEKDFHMVLVHIQRVPVILVHPDTEQKEAIVAAALEGVLNQSNQVQRGKYPVAPGG